MVESTKLIDAVNFCKLNDVRKYIGGADSSVLEDCRQRAKRQLAVASKWCDPDEREKAEKDSKELLKMIESAIKQNS